MKIRDANDSDRDFIMEKTLKEWGDEVVVVHNTIYRPYLLNAFIAETVEKKVGMLTYFIHEDSFEIVTIIVFTQRKAVGTKLINQAKALCMERGLKRLWLITTNDNVPAIKFYKKIGFSVKTVHHGAVEYARRLKPTIPITGHNGTEIRDEIEMEMIL